MKNINILIVALITLSFNMSFSQIPDQDKKSAIVFVEDSNQNVASGRIYASSLRGASRNGNGNSNSNFGNIGDWSVDFVVSEKSPSQAASDFIGPSHNGMGATGWGSFAAGAYNRASGAGAVAIGFHNAAGPLDSDESSIPTSGNTTNLGQFAVGYGTQATGHVAFSAGQGTTASGTASTALGYSTTASATYSTAIGEGTTASGSRSTAMGKTTIASDFASVVIGQFNSSGSSVTSSATLFNTANTAFVIGNGTASNSKSDAFKVMFNGNTTIGGNDLTIGDLSAFSGTFSQRSAIDVVAHADGDLMTGYISGSTGDRFNIELDANNSMAKISSGGGYDLTFSTEGGVMNFEGNGMDTATYAFDGNATVSDDLTVSGDVVVSSDARLKANIASLGSTIAKLLLIDGKSYTMKKDGKQKIGVLAQDVQKVFPELVSKDDNEMLAVNYQGLVPVLINALKEQDEKISRLENLVEKLISEK